MPFFALDVSIVVTCACHVAVCIVPRHLGAGNQEESGQHRDIGGELHFAGSAVDRDGQRDVSASEASEI